MFNIQEESERLLYNLRNKDIITNLDLDGISIGIILANYVNARIVGFSNSQSHIWVKPGIDPKKCVYLDIHMADPNIISVDQHIIGINAEHNDILRNLKTKFNPNLLPDRNKFFFGDYRNKFPFSCGYNILYNFDLVGIKVDLNLNEQFDENLKCGDIFLRSDDMMRIALDSKYMQNASEWRAYFLKLTNNGHNVSMIDKYLEENKFRDQQEIARNLAKLFKGEKYQCESKDGGYNKFVMNEDGTLRQTVKNFIDLVARVLNMKPFDYNGIFEEICLGASFRCTITEKKDELNQKLIKSIIENKSGDLVSYAFVMSKYNEKNFSYTTKKVDLTNINKKYLGL